MLQKWYKACLGSGFTPWLKRSFVPVAFLFRMRMRKWNNSFPSTGSRPPVNLGSASANDNTEVNWVEEEGKCMSEALGFQCLSLHVQRTYILLTSASVVLLKSKFALKIITRSHIETATFSLWLQGRGTLQVQINSAPVFSILLLWSFLRLVAW